MCSESKAARLTGSKRPVSSIKQRTGEESDSDNEFFASDDDANFGLALSLFLVGSKSSDKKKKHKQKHEVQEQPVAGISLAAHMSMRALRDKCVSAAFGLHRSISFPRRLTHSRSSRIGISRALAFDSRASQVVARSSIQRATTATSVASL